MKNLVCLEIVATFLLVLTVTKHVDGKRILVVAPAPLQSHQNVFKGLALALNERGHEVVYITANPSRNLTLTNYREIDFSVAYETIGRLKVKDTVWKFPSESKLSIDRRLHNSTITIAAHFYNHPEIKELYAEGSEKFDAILMEAAVGEITYGLVYKLKAPVIGVLSLAPAMIIHYTLGNTVLATHPTNWEIASDVEGKATFWDRLQNYIFMWRIIHQWRTLFLPEVNKFVRSHLGNDVPPLEELSQNMSLLLINYHPILSESRPLLPNMIFYNGFHIKKNPPPLPKDMGEFLGNATDGFVYMSLGSSMKSSILPAGALQAIYNVFSRLPYKVLWKFESSVLPGKSDNVFISKWTPQQSVLAHPNIKLFIYQGGLQSTEEAIHYGVPVLGMPVVFDQSNVVRKLVSLGVGRSLDFPEVTEETFNEAISDVLNDKRYKRNMMKLRGLMNDNPYDTREHAMWWIEYVMRHKGAPHLRFRGVADPWYQRYDMDVIAFLSIILFILTVACAIVIVQIWRWSYKYCFARIVPSQQRSKKNE